jgi:hypothetical protein
MPALATRGADAPSQPCSRMRNVHTFGISYNEDDLGVRGRVRRAVQGVAEHRTSSRTHRSDECAPLSSVTPISLDAGSVSTRRTAPRSAPSQAHQAQRAARHADSAGGAHHGALCVAAISAPYKLRRRPPRATDHFGGPPRHEKRGRDRARSADASEPMIGADFAWPAGPQYRASSRTTPFRRTRLYLSTDIAQRVTRGYWAQHSTAHRLSLTTRTPPFSAEV